MSDRPTSSDSEKPTPRGFYVEDFDQFDRDAEMYESQAAWARKSAVELRDSTRRAADGLPGSETARALRGLAVFLEAQQNDYADELAEMGRKLRETGRIYREFGAHGSNTIDPAAHIWADDSQD